MGLTNETTATVKTALMGAAAGAVALAIIGFTWGGWMTGSKATKMAAQQSSTAVVTALAPICVASFKMQPDAVLQLASLQKLTGSERTGFVEKGGWAAALGTKETVAAITRACADSLAGMTATDL
jgi:hypothetical protein